MFETKELRAGGLPSQRSVVLLGGPQMTPEDGRLTQLLDFFEVSYLPVTFSEVKLDGREGRYAVVSSAVRLSEAIQDTAVLPPWLASASSVYVYGFQEGDLSTKLLRMLTGDPQAEVTPVQKGETKMTVTRDFPEMCGPMSGMQVPATLHEPVFVCDSRRRETFQSIIRTDQGELFFGVRYGGVRFYLNTWGRTVDIGACAPSYFDVRQSLCEAVPIVFYLTWMFRGPSSSRAEINACLIVDDPPLKRRYGFLDFREALGLMNCHKFSTTIAFIPWNWRRSDPDTVKLFQRHPDKLSLVVHGCNHTANEFATRSPAVLNAKIRTSIERMRLFQQTAEIEADRVMVFPQGVFSPETGRALKLNGFLAAVNTEIAPSEVAANETTVADLWNIAIMKYGTFPIFTRRYANHGIENFAFDALLGKPCLIASHHEVFKDHACNLIDFVGRLNSLEWNLVWRPLGDVVRRSAIIHCLDDGTRVVRIFASSSLVETPETQRTLLLKNECDPNCVHAVCVNERPVEFSFEGGSLRAWLPLIQRERVIIRVVYRNNLEAIANGDSSQSGIKVAAKRYLSEFRDNYLSRSDFLHKSTNRLKRRAAS
jgi:hypothetical protein